MAVSKDIILALYRAYGSGDPVAIAALLADEVIWVAPPGNATQVALDMGHGADAGPPDGSNNLGKAAIIDFMVNDFARLFTNATNVFTLILEDGDHVMVEHRLSATLVNGRSYVNDYCFVFRVANGRVIAIREYMDTRGGWVQMFGTAEGEPVLSLLTT